jgi:hypothetical protein
VGRYLFLSLFFLSLQVHAVGLFESIDELSEGIYQDMPYAFLKPDPLSFEQELRSRIYAPSDWQDKVNTNKINFICIGERHQDNFREQIALNLLQDLNLDQLMLETKYEDVEPLLSTYRSGEATNLLNAKMNKILDSVITKNANIKITGVEIVQEQSARMTWETIRLQQKRLSRESFIAYNMLQNYQEGDQVGVLHGAAHCGNLSKGLALDTPFYKLLQPVLVEKGLSFTNIKVVFAKDEPVLNSYLIRYGLIAKSPIILSDVQNIKPEVFNYHHELVSLFANYDNYLVIP